MRKPLIAGNWKMFLDVNEAKALVKGICESDISYSKVDVLLAPSFTNIYPVSEEVKKYSKPIAVAAQNIYFEDSGAYTGEVSAAMLKSAGASCVIIGHSERRNIFKECDCVLNKKVHKALSSGFGVILCVGEKLEERESCVATEVVISQLGKSLKDVTDLSNVIIAYEPVWAIGTGKTASKEDAQVMHSAIRSFILNKYGQNAAENIRILYGGSVKPENAGELISMPDIDGALVGGASLKADQFLAIIRASVQPETI